MKFVQSQRRRPFLLFQISFLETEKTDLERRLESGRKSASLSPLAPHQQLFDIGAGGDVVDHVRAQVPLRASVAVTKNGSEQLIRVKLLEQENERYVRKIKGLESQLSELERVSLISMCIQVTFLPCCEEMRRFRPPFNGFIRPPNVKCASRRHLHSLFLLFLTHNCNSG